MTVWSKKCWQYWDLMRLSQCGMHGKVRGKEVPLNDAILNY